jgi:hypothetical protein
MNLEELKEIFKAGGWTLHLHNRRTQGKKYAYAAWREGQKVKQLYVAPLARLEEMSREQVVEKLATLKK